METSSTDATVQSQPSAAAPAKGSAVRLASLLGILALALGALAYDQFMAKPNCDAANQSLEEFVQKMNAQPVTLDGGGIVGRADVQKHIGWGPTRVKDNDKDGYTIEYYCWWGYVPLNRHFISVLYKGKSRRYAAHYQAEPPQEDLPSTVTPKPAETAGGEATGGEQPATTEKKEEPAAPQEDADKAAKKGAAAPDSPKEAAPSAKPDKDK